MGTSAARRAPTTRLWRLAKGAAFRYLSPESGGAVTAGEVAARYLAALGEGEQGPLAAWRFTRKVAQNLGAWAAQAASRGWEAALKARGLGQLAGHSPEVVAQGMGSALVGADCGLEGEVARVALTAILRESGITDASPHPAPMGPDRLVPRFLAAALYLRLALDLGEPLEAAGASVSRIKEGLDGLKGCLEPTVPVPTPATPEDPAAWQGLPGWTWVTGVLETMLARLRASSRSRHDRPTLP